MSFNISSHFQSIPPVVKNLLIINIGIYFVMALIPAFDHAMTKYCALYYFSSPAFLPFQLISYMFLHSSFMHLLFNMFALWMFGGIVERSMGSERFLFYYFTTGIGAALIQMGVFALCISNLASLLPDGISVSYIADYGYQIMQNGRTFLDPDLALLNSYINTPMVGASGAIYGLILAFAFLFPNAPIYLFFIPVPIKAKYLAVGYFILELLMGVSSQADSVAHFAHLGGMIFGFALLWYWRKKGIFNNRWYF